MAQSSGHEGGNLNNAPDLIQLSAEEAARLAALASGGSFDEPQEMTAPTQPVYPPANANRQANGNTSPLPLPISPKGTATATADGTSGAGVFGTPLASGPAGSKAITNETGATPANVGAGTFGTTTGSAQAPVRKRGHRGGSLLPATLPELWGLDLALGIISVVGIVLIIKNLPQILVSIASIVFTIVDGAMEIGLVLAVIAFSVMFLFRRRRRRW